MPEYDIFLSHASKDKPQVELMYEEMEELGFSVWFDKDNIHGGNKWTQAIQDGVDNSKVFVVVWTENASNSEWVDKEITRALSKNIRIIPFLRDSTELKITIQDIQYIDARSRYSSAFRKLVSRINVYVKNEVSEQNSKSFAWLYQKQPFFRSEFLEENSYLDVRNDDFAINEWTDNLHYYRKQKWSKADKFVSFVGIPLPKTIDVDIKSIQPSISHYEQQQYETPWRRLSYLSETLPKRKRGEYILYNQPGNADNLQLRNYMRFDENGNFEFADAYYSAFDLDQRQKHREGFRLISILGATWKLLNFLAHYYTEHEYSDQFQFIVNMHNTDSSILDGFAEEHGYGWESPLQNIQRWNRNSGISNNKHLQFVYNISVVEIMNNPKLSEEIILDLSERIQWAFDLEYKPRHAMPKTEEFHWNSYPHDLL